LIESGCVCEIKVGHLKEEERRRERREGRDEDEEDGRGWKVIRD